MMLAALCQDAATPGRSRKGWSVPHPHFSLQPLLDAPIKGSLAQCLCISWLRADREQEHAKLLEACRPPAKASAPPTLLTAVAVNLGGGSPLFPKLPRSLGFQFLQVVDQASDLLLALALTHTLRREHVIAVTRVSVIVPVAMPLRYANVSTRASCSSSQLGGQPSDLSSRLDIAS